MSERTARFRLVEPSAAGPDSADIPHHVLQIAEALAASGSGALGHTLLVWESEEGPEPGRSCPVAVTELRPDMCAASDTHLAVRGSEIAGRR